MASQGMRRKEQIVETAGARGRNNQGKIREVSGRRSRAVEPGEPSADRRDNQHRDVQAHEGTVGTHEVERAVCAGSKFGSSGVVG